MRSNSIAICILSKSRGVYNIIERRCDLSERQREQHKGDPVVRQDKAFDAGADPEDEHKDGN